MLNAVSDRFAHQAPPVEIDTSGWLATAVPAPAMEPLASDMRTKVAIVGGGYTGLTAALTLAEGHADVAVFEADDVGFGASGRNGGQVIPGFKHDPDTLAALFGQDVAQKLIAFGGAAATRTFDLIQTHQLACNASDAGWIQPALTPGQLERVTQRATQWQAHTGADIELLSAERVQALTGTSAYVGGWLDRRGGQLQPLSYARELARVALAAGCSIYPFSRVSAVRREAGGWRLTANGRSVHADKVIVATNGYSSDLLPSVRRSIITAFSIQTATEPLTDAIRRHVLPSGLPVSDARRLLKYMRLDPAGRFVIGGRGSFGDHQPERYFSRLRDSAIKMFPALKDVRWERSWGGKFALTVDHLPHIHNPAPDLFVGLGYCGRGVALASQMGPMLASLCLGRPARELPIPVTELSEIPFHFLRRPVLESVALWYRILDRIDG